MNNMNPVVYGLIVAIIGIAVVFSMLTILILFVSMMGKVFQSITKSKEEKAKAAAAAPAPAAPAPAPVAEAPAVVEESTVVDDAELIAVIAAAIAAYDNSGKNLVVRKVRRVAGWKDAARSEQVYHF